MLSGSLATKTEVVAGEYREIQGTEGLSDQRNSTSGLNRSCNREIFLVAPHRKPSALVRELFPSRMRFAPWERFRRTFEVARVRR